MPRAHRPTASHVAITSRYIRVPPDRQPERADYSRYSGVLTRSAAEPILGSEQGRSSCRGQSASQPSHYTPACRAPVALRFDRSWIGEQFSITRLHCALRRVRRRCYGLIGVRRTIPLVIVVIGVVIRHAVPVQRRIVERQGSEPKAPETPTPPDASPAISIAAAKA